MKMTFRWYGDTDPVPLNTSGRSRECRESCRPIYDVPVGEAWPVEKHPRAEGERSRRTDSTFDVVESVPVHEDIKLGKPTRETD